MNTRVGADVAQRLWRKVVDRQQPLTIDESVDLLGVVADQRALISVLWGRDYGTYLLSDGWQARRAQALLRAGSRCQLCNYPHRLEVHHRTYDRLGAERPDDLIVLCRRCHQRHHGLAA